MRLEDVLDAEDIAAIDGLGKEVRLTIEDALGRCGGAGARCVAYGLESIAYYTKDKDAVIEAARTIGRYKGAPYAIAREILSSSIPWKDTGLSGNLRYSTPFTGTL